MVDAPIEDGSMCRKPHGVIGFMKEFTPPEVLYEHLIEVIKKYHPSTDVSRIEQAYKYAKESHGDQMRKSGEPYIIHPLSVAIILAELEMDKETIMAGLLHDVLEDTEVTDEQMKDMFGDEVFLLVDGVTKLTQLKYTHDKVEVQAENLRKMFLAMAKDIRVIIIKLADRLHNMRTLKYQRDEKQVEISKETLEIYSPLAQRLGISMIKTELDDLSLKYIHPDVYKDIAEQINATRFEREAFISQIVTEVRGKLDEVGIKAEVDGRAKHFFSIYRKMVNKQKTIDQIYDLFAVRIIVDSVKDCYHVLGEIHDMYKPMPGRFKDYIAMPKPNMYQSLHTTLISSTGRPVEIQIRTFDMHRTAEYGIAAHWKYKETQDGKKTGDGEEEKLTWLREILEWQRESKDNKEFLNLVKSDLDLFSEDVYAFTPSGDVIRLTQGSCIIDFAYAIHSAVGNKMIGGKVNGNLVPLEYEVKNGDRIEILTSQNTKGPKHDWLKIVKSTKAKNKINQWFRTENKEDDAIRGKEQLQIYCKSKNINLSELLKPEYMQACLTRYSYKDWESLLAGIGHGSLKEGQVISKLKESHDRLEKKNYTETTDEIIQRITEKKTEKESIKKDKKDTSLVRIKGFDVGSLDIHYGKCCTPVPGDEIVGFVTKGRGLSVHRSDCINMINLPEQDRAKIIEAYWDDVETSKDDFLINTRINIYSEDRIGILADVTRIMAENNMDIKSMEVRNAKKGLSTYIIYFVVKGIHQLELGMKKLKQIPGVVDVERSKS